MTNIYGQCWVSLATPLTGNKVYKNDVVVYPEPIIAKWQVVMFLSTNKLLDKYYTIIYVIWHCRRQILKIHK